MERIFAAPVTPRIQPGQFAALGPRQLVWREALKAVSRSALEQGKTSNESRRHQGTYTELRTHHWAALALGLRLERKAHRANRVYSQWSLGELQAQISHEAVLSGTQALKVDADSIKKTCPVCGHTSDENRPRFGSPFTCHNPN